MLTFSTDWVIKGLILGFLNIFALFYPGWGYQQGYLLDDLDLNYGVFYVCGFSSSSLVDFDSDCYNYDSSSTPLPFERITNWHMLVSCGHCSSRRRATGAFQVLSTIATLFMLFSALYHRVGRKRVRVNGDMFVLLCFVSGFTSMIAFAVWAEAMRRYNKPHLFGELGYYRGDPRLHLGVCFGLAICVFLLSFLFMFIDFVEIFGRFFPQRPAPRSAPTAAGDLELIEALELRAATTMGAAGPDSSEKASMAYGSPEGAGEPAGQDDNASLKSSAASDAPPAYIDVVGATTDSNDS